MLKVKHTLNSSLFLKIVIFLLLLFILKNCLIPRSHQNDSETVINKPVLTTSVCDEILRRLDIDSEPVIIFDGVLAEVDFSTIPEAKLYYTVITEAVAAGPNLAGHYTIAIWGCGTSCAGHAIVDVISGKIIKYLPVNEQINLGNQFSSNINSRILVFNPKESFYYAKDKTFAELVDDARWDWSKSREYYEIVDQENGETWIHKICSENVLSGILGPDLSTVEYAKLKRISTSGDARFYQYDVEMKELNEDEFSWFFALPNDVVDDSNIADVWVKFIKENKDSVFKISGLQDEDDCGYYGPDHCIKNIDVKTIEVVGENKIMEF